MGCTASSEKKADPKRNVELVKASWATIKNAFELQAVADLFYATLFKQNPEYTKTLFKGVDHKKQAKKLIEMIDAAVGLLGDFEKLVPILKDLGERPGAYGVEDKDYAPVGAALFATLKKGLGEKLTEDDKAAWVWVYGGSTMQKGAKTEKGQRLLAEYKEKKAAEQKKAFEAVQASWATVKGAFELQAVGDLFYATLFEQNPEYTHTLFKGVDHKKQAKKLIEMIDAVVGLLSEVEKLVPILEDLGERPGAYGVEDKDYAPVGTALIATLKVALGKKLTKTDEAAWVEVYGIIETAMQKGAKSQRLAKYKEKKAAKQNKTFEAVQASWATVKKAFKLQAVGDLFYATLVEQNPEYTKTLFKGVDHKTQAKKLIEMIDAAVGMLDDLDKLVPILEDLGERHGAYGVEDKDYAPVGTALIATLKVALGKKLTKTDEAAWVEVYGIIETAMQKGAKSQRLAKYKEKKAAKQNKTFEAVQASWATVKGAFELQAVGDLFYATLVEQNPEYTKTLFKGVDHKKQAKTLIEMIDAAVGMLDDLDKLVPILEDLGERHGAYGVEDKDYAPVGTALIATLKVALGKKLTKTDEAAWVEVYGIIETAMQKGAKTEKGQRLLAEYKEKRAKKLAAADRPLPQHWTKFTQLVEKTGDLGAP